MEPLRNFLKILNELGEFAKCLCPALTELASGQTTLLFNRSEWFQGGRSQQRGQRALTSPVSSAHLEPYVPSHQALGQLNSPGAAPSHPGLAKVVSNYWPQSFLVPSFNRVENLQVGTGRKQGAGPGLHPRTPSRLP